MTKLQWTLLTISGIMFILSVNVWAAKRDHKLLQMYHNPSTYSLQCTLQFVTGSMIIKSANMQGLIHTNKH